MNREKTDPSLTRAQLHRHTGTRSRTAVLTALLFMLGFFLLMIFAARGYRDTVQTQQANAERRAQLAYLTSVIRGGDIAGAVTVEQTAYGPTLCVTEGGYTLRIFCDGQRLLEHYGPENGQPDAQLAQSLGQTRRFDAAQEDGLLTICTDEGRLLLRLRSEQAP